MDSQSESQSLLMSQSQVFAELSQRDGFSSSQSLLQRSSQGFPELSSQRDGFSSSQSQSFLQRSSQGLFTSSSQQDGRSASQRSSVLPESSSSLHETLRSSQSLQTTVSAESQRLSEFTKSLLNEVRQQKVKAKETIESLVLSIIDTIVEGRPPILERPRLINNSRDIRRVQQNPGLTTKIIFGKRSHRTFTMQIYVMSLVYRMIQQNQTSTLRDLYYESMNFFGNQSRLSSAVKELSLLLKVPREALCLEASAKGLVAGFICFKQANGQTVRALDSRHGLIVPNKLHELTITTDAKFILFVEKDATFQRLLDENIFTYLGPMILITGKGYPDMQTRRLMCILNRVHKLKVYALVDCDPYGIEIAAVVKWGSYRNSNDNSENENYYLTPNLAIPDLVWLGLLPSEQASLSLTLNASAQLTERDQKKLISVAERIQLQNHDPWLNEVRILQRLGQKTELEALFSSPMFTSTVYLPSKLLSVNHY